ncbi:hypothetical protein SAMN02910456_02216 [Ruminococcaceae bacterium YRB3002]|nr:hypothetical protein SAMN02910456_02216 [Ruminococcaceae bacterium YRB3002]
MNRMLDIIMLIVLVPTVLIIFFLEYPANWKDRKFIFGVRNREEFKDAAAAERIGTITQKCRKHALIIMICCLAAAVLTMIIPDLVIRMSIWVVLTIAALVVMMVPLVIGNREMKSLKSELGIASQKGVTYTDLKGTGNVRVLKLNKVIIPNAVAAVFFIAALLNDLGIVKLHGLLNGQGTTAGLVTSGFAGAQLAVGLIMLPISVAMDRIRNEVISEDSDVNMNYNRARKKVWADTFVMFAWVNTAFIILSLILVFIFDSQIVFLAACGIYLLLIMAALMYMARRSIAVDRRYRQETSIDIDDDDNWILGSIYYNPDDKRLNVAKRIGFGGTVNAAHPVGKAVYVLTVLIFIGTFVMLGYILLLSRTPMTVRIADNSLICCQMTDDYEIPLGSIDNAELCTGSKDLNLRRDYGIDMDNLQKGKYMVNGESGCVVFLDLNADSYLVIHADGKTYYINCTDVQETAEIYEEINKR